MRVMESLFRYVACPTPCGYLPDRLWSLEYEYVRAMTPAEYLQRMLEGWRRFGTMLFRPACPTCTACRSLRVYADDFRPDRSQRRARKANEGVLELRIGRPSVSRAKLAAYVDLIAEVVRAGQESGELSGGISPATVKRAVFGALDELALGWLMSGRRTSGK